MSSTQSLAAILSRFMHEKLTNNDNELILRDIQYGMFALPGAQRTKVRRGIRLSVSPEKLGWSVLNAHPHSLDESILRHFCTSNFLAHLPPLLWGAVPLRPVI